MSVYLDYNASAPMKPAALEAASAALALVGNPSSIHGPGRAARAVVERARDAARRLAGAATADVIFTSGGTESCNLGVRGLSGGVGAAHILASAIEHAAITLSAEHTAQARAVPFSSIPCDGAGRVDAAALERLLTEQDGPALVCVMLANNETGALQPIQEIAEIAKSAGAVILCDAAQAPGRIPFSFDDLGVDAMILSAHKFGGPKGVGALILREGTPFESRILGGGQERGYRAGTENVPGLAGFAAAAEACAEDLARAGDIAAMRDRLETAVTAAAPDAVLFSADGPRLPNTACFAAPGFAAETQLMALDLDGIAVSSGSACSSGKVEPSHVLSAMGASDDLAASAIRVSLGWATTNDDIDAFAAAWPRAHARAAGRRMAS